MVQDNRVSDVDGNPTPPVEGVVSTPYSPPTVLTSETAQKELVRGLTRLSQITGKEYSL